MDTSSLYSAKVCLKFLRKDRTDVIMSEPFHLEVNSITISLLGAFIKTGGLFGA